MTSITGASRKAGSGGCDLASPASASVAHLKKYGPATSVSLATTRSSVAQVTRALRSARSAGHIYGHRLRNVPKVELSETVFSANLSCLLGGRSAAAGIDERG